MDTQEETVSQVDSTNQAESASAMQSQVEYSVDVQYRAATGLKTDIVSGVFTNLSADGLINLVFYTERRAFPSGTSFLIKDGKLTEGGDKFEDGSGLVRELTQSILVTKHTAEFIIEALQTSLNRMQKKTAPSAVTPEDSAADDAAVSE